MLCLCLSVCLSVCLSLSNWPIEMRNAADTQSVKFVSEWDIRMSNCIH